MTDEEYRVIQRQLKMMTEMVLKMDLSRFLARIKKHEARGPITVSILKVSKDMATAFLLARNSLKQDGIFVG